MTAGGSEGPPFATVVAGAIHARGDEYLLLERQLLAEGDAAASALATRLDDDDGVAQLLAGVVLQWIRGERPEYAAALEYLDRVARVVEGTPVPFPPPEAVARYLSREFAGRAADLLALRLAKEVGSWPAWKSTAVLLYLGERKEPATTAALLRIAVEAAQWRTMALWAIRQIADPELRAKIDAERRLHGSGPRSS